MTHILYRKFGKIQQYFSGLYTGELDEDGVAPVSFKWTENKTQATIMLTTDAWDLLGMCRRQWDTIEFHVERINEAI